MFSGGSEEKKKDVLRVHTRDMHLQKSLTVGVIGVFSLVWIKESLVYLVWFIKVSVKSVRLWRGPDNWTWKQIETGRGCSVKVKNKTVRFSINVELKSNF